MKKSLYRFPIYLIVLFLYLALSAFTGLSDDKLGFIFLIIPIYYLTVRAIPEPKHDH
ncbi:hypothetical protein [Lactococcus termiticola]|uniref:Uncharacterized protein n=1 Tax=Lactococcus termiticola TaxID=2169526 RepID=A0A2R5HG83_9LACT|nr:hypothetical protein [Lactococcus termiticola]GBG97024.1 hypothetical protein NtB2_01161 [Lactococcus termiticola]